LSYSSLAYIDGMCWDRHYQELMATFLDRHLCAGVSPNPSDYLEPLNQRVEKSGNFISSCFHLMPPQVEISGTNWKHTLSGE
jgi:hypothetical protein